MSDPTPTVLKLPKRRFQLASKASLRRLGMLGVFLAALLVIAWFVMIRMPGTSHTGPLDPLTADERAIAVELAAHVKVMVEGDGTRPAIGNRALFNPKQMAFVAAYLQGELASYGYDQITEIPVPRGAPTPNFEVVIPGTSKPVEIIVIGAHYDAYQGTPGADDNASGVSACLAIAKRLRLRPQARTVRVVLFVNEEPPTFQQPEMGSWVYARRCRAAGDNIVAMISLECLGYFKDQSGTQKYPFPLSTLYPNTGNFIGVIGDVSSRDLVRSIIADFRSHTRFPSEGAALPGTIPGVGWSDHWAFWQEGYRAVMITDTALFRNPNYHQPTDTPNTLEYERMARVTAGVQRVVETLASE